MGREKIPPLPPFSSYSLLFSSLLFSSSSYSILPHRSRSDPWPSIVPFLLPISLLPSLSEYIQCRPRLLLALFCREPLRRTIDFCGKAMTDHSTSADEEFQRRPPLTDGDAKGKRLTRLDAGSQITIQINQMRATFDSLPRRETNPNAINPAN